MNPVVSENSNDGYAASRQYSHHNFTSAGLSFPWRKFSARLLVNHTGEHLVGYSTDPSRLRYKVARTAWNVNFSYTVSPKLQFYFDIQNMFNARQEWFYFERSRLQADFDNGAFVNFGISGRF